MTAFTWSKFTILFVLFCGLLQGCSGDRQSSAVPNQAEPSTQKSAGPVESAIVPAIAGGTQQSVTLQNGLEVLLISNPGYTKASAAMAIPVGSWSDPEEHQGLAHFLEHMLFLGTKEYPKAGEYAAEVARNGGYTNAYTGAVLTNYLFEVNTNALPGVLRRFSRFFVSPTLDPAYIEKERNAVHSEFDKNLKSDSWRFWHMFGTTEPAGHPDRKFNIGSRKSLANATPEVVRAFYEKHYSSDTMKLVVLAPLPIAELKALVVENFADVPNRNLKGRPSELKVPDSQPGQWLEMKSIGAKNELTIAFPDSSYELNWQSKPGSVLGSLIGTESEGSLASILKRKQLINTLSAESYDPGGPGVGSGYFFISMQLSDKGHQERDEVLKTVFAYLGELQRVGVKNYFFTQRQSLARLGFETRGATDGADEASRISALMLKYPALEVNERSMLLYAPDTALVEKFLKNMTPENATILVQDPKARVDQVDPIFGVEYSLKAISAKTKTEWKKAMASAPNGFVYPPANTWIPASLVLVKGETATQPRVLLDDSKGKIWFQQETGPLAKPMAFATIRIWTPEISRSARSYLLSILYSKAFALSQAERFAPLDEAEYKIGLSATYDEVVVQVSGYSEKFPQVLNDVLASSTSKLSALTISDDDLVRMKDELKQDIATYKVSSAIKRAVARKKALALKPSYEVEDYQDLVDSVTAKELSDFAKTLFSRIYVDGLIYGNLSPDSVVGLVPAIVENLGAESLSTAEREYRAKEDLLKSGDRFVSVMSGADNNNGMIVQMDNGPRTYENVARNLVLGNLIEDDFYTEMRTNQQLGYIVQGGASTSRESTHLDFYIQSGDYAPDELAKRTAAYLNSFVGRIDATLATGFEVSRNGLIQELSRKAPSMPDRFVELDGYFRSRDADWSYSDRVVIALGKLKKEEVKLHAEKSLAVDQQARRSIFYYGAGKSVPTEFGNDVLIRR